MLKDGALVGICCSEQSTRLLVQGVPRNPLEEVKDRGVCLIQAFQNDQTVVRFDLKSVEMV
jgi:hypothetical protein